MLTLVEFCDSNLAAGSWKVKERLEKNPEIDVIEYPCLGFCSECARSPYALVEGNVVSGASLKELLQNIEKEIDKSQESAFF